MKNKRIISILLLAAMLVGAVACGDSAGTSADTEASDITVASDLSEDTAPSEYTDPKVDYNGEKITIASYSYSSGYVIHNYNIALDTENADTINDAIVNRNRTVEDMLNIEIDIFPLEKNDRNKADKLMNPILAGENVYDFALHMQGSLATFLTTDGALVDLNTVPTLDLSHSWWNQNANEEYTIYDTQYAAVGDISFFNLGAPVCVYFSKKLIEDNKLENPYQLVRDGKWTLDKMSQLATAAARDLNGDTEIQDSDQFGLATEPWVHVSYMLCAGSRASERDKDGNIVFTLNSDRTADIAEKVVTLLNNQQVTRLDGKTSEKYTSVYTDYFIPKLMADELLFFQNQLHISLNLRQMDNDFGIIPMAKYDEKQENYLSVPNTGFSDHLIIPATTTKLDMIGNVIEAMGYYAQQYITPAYIDTAVMGKSIRDEDSAEMVEMILDNMVFDVAVIFNWGNFNNTMNSMISSGNTGFASTWAGIESAVQKSLQETIDKLKK